MKFYAVEVILPDGKTNLHLFHKRWQAKEMYWYLVNYGNCVHFWEL